MWWASEDKYQFTIWKFQFNFYFFHAINLLTKPFGNRWNFFKHLERMKYRQWSNLSRATIRTNFLLKWNYFDVPILIETARTKQRDSKLFSSNKWRKKSCGYFFLIILKVLCWECLLFYYATNVINSLTEFFIHEFKYISNLLR